jgi:hypothetical protein
MISLRKASERDLFWNFARAEFEVPSHGVRHLQPQIAGALKARILRDERATFSDEDWAALRTAVLSTRSDLLQPLVDLGLNWYEGELPPSRLRELRVMNLRIFLALAPRRSLDDFVDALEAGAVPGGWDPAYYPRLRSTFDRRLMHGDPIVVSQHPSGPYTLIEGTTRMCVLRGMQRLGQLPSLPIRMVLGMGPQLRQWPFY